MGIVAGLLLTTSAMATGPVTAADETSKPNAADGFRMNGEVRTGVRGFAQLSLSPDGSKVLAVIKETTEQGGRPHLWLLGPGADARQLTTSPNGDQSGESDGKWTGDGKAFLFLAKRDGTRSLLRQTIDGGKAQRLQISKSVDGHVKASWGGDKKDGLLSVGGFALSPDGKTIALWADDPQSPAVKKRKDRKDDAYAIDEDDDRTHLYMVEAATGKARQVAIKGHFQQVRWSYDSADLLVTTDPDPEAAGLDVSVWRIAMPSLEVTRLNLPKTVKTVSYLPGRNETVFTARCKQDAPPGCYDLYVANHKGGDIRNLTHGLDGYFPSDFVLAPNGDVVAAVLVHMRTRIARIAPATGKIDWFDMAQPTVTLLSTNANQNGWAMVASGSEQTPEVVWLSKFGDKPTRLKAPTTAPSYWAAVPSRIITWSNDGLKIEGALYLPKIEAGKKVPLVVNVHGGPAGRFADGYSNLVQMLVAEGWAVLQPNPRGSTGYGAKFMAANRNDLGGGDFRDIMAGVDAVVEKYPIDAQRMALIGYSYGGEIAAFAAGKTDRFKALVAGGPVINQFSEYGTEDENHLDRWYYGRPWDKFDDVWRQSPIAYVKNARTPFLLLHGAEDETDPLGQSQEMWRALKQYDVPVELIVYPRESHTETAYNFLAMPSAEPWHGVDLRRRMFGFLRAAFAGQPDPLSAAR